MFKTIFTVPPKYNARGCFRSNRRPLPNFLTGQYRYKYNKWKAEDFPQMVIGCAVLAWRSGYGVFSVEYGGECWAAPTGTDYTQGGPALDNDTSGCKHNVGFAPRKMYVYEF